MQNTALFFLINFNVTKIELRSTNISVVYILQTQKFKTGSIPLVAPISRTS